MTNICSFFFVLLNSFWMETNCFNTRHMCHQSSCQQLMGAGNLLTIAMLVSLLIRIEAKSSPLTILFQTRSGAGNCWASDNAFQSTVYMPIQLLSHVRVTTNRTRNDSQVNSQLIAQCPEARKWKRHGIVPNLKHITHVTLKSIFPMRDSKMHKVNLKPFVHFN